MKSPTKEPLTVTRCFTPDGSQGGKFSHSCDEDMSESDQIEMLVHDLDVIVKQLTELAGPTATFQEIKPILSDLISLSQEEQIENLTAELRLQTARNIVLEEENEQMKERLIEK
jgi:hypothetical protein